MATLTTSFNIIVKTNAIIWDDIAQEVKNGNVTVGTTYPLKFTDGTSTIMEVIDIDETTGDAVFADTNGVDVSIHDEGAPSIDISWDNCSGRTYLNGEYLNKFPSNIRNKIKQKDGKYYKCANSTTMAGVRGNITEILTITDTIWVPTLENVISADKVNKDYTPISGQKTYYRYRYENTEKYKYAEKRYLEGWWLSSPFRRIPETNINYANKLYAMAVFASGSMATLDGGHVTLYYGMVPHFILPGT